MEREGIEIESEIYTERERMRGKSNTTGVHKERERERTNTCRVHGQDGMMYPRPFHESSAKVEACKLGLNAFFRLPPRKFRHHTKTRIVCASRAT